jgi:hypothetical protein
LSSLEDLAGLLSMCHKWTWAPQVGLGRFEGKIHLRTMFRKIGILYVYILSGNKSVSSRNWIFFFFLLLQILLQLSAAEFTEKVTRALQRPWGRSCAANHPGTKSTSCSPNRWAAIPSSPCHEFWYVSRLALLIYFLLRVWGYWQVLGCCILSSDRRAGLHTSTSSPQCRRGVWTLCTPYVGSWRGNPSIHEVTCIMENVVSYMNLCNR